MLHQQLALDWAARRTSIALFLEMRLGKTLVAIRWAARFAGPKLVVAPLGALHSWVDELLLERQHSYRLWSAASRHRIELPDNADSLPEWNLINPEGLLTRQKESLFPGQLPASHFGKYHWPTVILDESAKFKNPQATVTRIATRYLSRASQKAILSGLPNPESDLDFFEQFRFLMGSFLGHKNYWRFRAHRFHLVDRFNWQPRPGTRKAIQNAVHRDGLVRSRKDVGLGNQLIRSVRYVELPGKVRKAYQQAERLYAVGKTETRSSLTVFNWLQQLAGGYPKEPSFPGHEEKTRAVLDLATTDLRDQQFLVWFHYLREGKAVQQALRYIGIRAYRIRGATPIHTRHTLRQWFQAGDAQVLCVQYMCGRYGLDFSAASTSIFFSEPTSYDAAAQARERIAHPKKREPLFLLSLVAKDTIDEDVHWSLCLKKKRSRNMLAQIDKRIKARWR